MPLQHVALLDPEITLRHDGGKLRVWSERYGDVYFSAEDGFAESMAVFGQGAELPQRLAHNPRFAVGELGFGSGLNFCMTLKLFRQYAPPDARLYYFATENAPLDAETMAEILGAFRKSLMNDRNWWRICPHVGRVGIGCCSQRGGWCLTSFTAIVCRI